MIIRSRYNAKTSTTTFINMGDDNKGWTYEKYLGAGYVRDRGVDVYKKDGRFLLVGAIAKSVKVTGVIHFSSRSELDLFLESYEDRYGIIQLRDLSELFDTISGN